ncbi:MAG: hypothetical protein GWP18_05050, partial [Proteobacteria bacterium]|nr:hypothetical protein [Pseudomonadota bacterium]
MNITIVGFPGIPQRVVDMVDAASNALASAGFEVARVDVPALGLPDTISTEELATWNAFTLTPGSLVESWRIARHLEALVQPGSRVLIVDHLGKGGMFALEQAMTNNEATYEVWTLAGAGRVLDELDTFAVAVGSDDETVAAIDWELVQYRFSARVIALAERTRSLLGGMDVDTDLLRLPILPTPRTRRRRLPQSGPACPCRCRYWRGTGHRLVRRVRP